MNKDAPRVLQRVVDAWQSATFGLAQMYQASQIAPSNGFEVFRIDPAAPDEVVKLNFGPIVLYVPERPNRRGPDLFVVVEGWLTLEGPDFKIMPLRTKTFGTEVAYFRQKSGNLEHVYGAHYDMDEEKSGHPVFHAQLGSKCAFGGAVLDLFKRDEAIVGEQPPPERRWLQVTAESRIGPPFGGLRSRGSRRPARAAAGS